MRSIIAKGLIAICSFNLVFGSTAAYAAVDTISADSVEDLTSSINTLSCQASDNYNIIFDGNSIDADGLIVTESDSLSYVTISANGIYNLSGSGKNVYINLSKSVDARFVFDNLEIDNSDAESYFITAGKKAANSAISIELSGESSIKGGEGAFSAKYSEINISGDSLNIDSSADDAIKAKDGTVNISSGNINITACKGDGIQAENIDISGGEIYISTYYENAATGFYTSGSYSSGSSTAYNYLWESGNYKYERVNLDLGSHKGIKAGTKAKTIKFKDGTDDISVESSGSLKITGGTIVIDTTASGLKANSITGSGYSAAGTGTYIIGSPDDAIASNADIEISDAKLTLNAADDGISASGTIVIDGSSDIEIKNAYEGIEGQTVKIGESGSSTPNITICSNDDGINTSGKTLTYTYDSYDEYDDNDGDLYYTKKSYSSDSGNNLYLYSGNLVVKIDSENSKNISLPNGSNSSLKSLTYKASGDGIDCNGSFYQYGGQTYIYGQSSGDNSPVDTNDGFRFNSGSSILGTGVDGMNEATPDSGDGIYITYGSSTGRTPGNNPGNDPGNRPGNGGSSYSAGQYWMVSDSDGNTIDYGILNYAGQFIVYGSPKLESGKSYTLSVVDNKPETDSQGGDNNDSSDNKSLSNNTVKTTIKIADRSYSVQYKSSISYNGKRIKIDDFQIDGQTVGNSLSGNVIFKKLKYKKNKNIGTAYVYPVFKAASGADSSLKSAIKTANKTLKSSPLEFSIVQCALDSSAISGTATYKSSSGKWSFNLKMALSTGSSIRLKKSDFDVISSSYDEASATVQIQGKNNFTGTATIKNIVVK